MVVGRTHAILWFVLAIGIPEIVTGKAESSKYYGKHREKSNQLFNTEQFIEWDLVFQRTKNSTGKDETVLVETKTPSFSNRDLRKRSKMPESEVEEILDKHNALRRLEGASDMQMLKWSSYMADMADEWTQNCIWKHGQPYRDPATRPFQQIGQNLYAVSGGKLDLSSAIQNWYDEKPYYSYDMFDSFDKAGCMAGKMCGHYTQVVWAKSREIGCAYTLCPTLSNGFKNAYFLVCNYGPAGNVIGDPIYQRGPSCTRCPSGAGWCTDDLCNSDCEVPGPQCSCLAVCKNSGLLEPETCLCSCANGWHGQDCSEVCEDKNTKCNPKPGSSGWPPSWCDHAQNGDIVRQNCPAMCKLCQVSSLSNRASGFDQSAYCRKACAKGLGGNMCNCNPAHFTGKRAKLGEELDGSDAEVVPDELAKFRRWLSLVKEVASEDDDADSARGADKMRSWWKKNLSDSRVRQ